LHEKKKRKGRGKKSASKEDFSGKDEGTSKLYIDVLRSE
jgi:hypothetical protein